MLEQRAHFVGPLTLALSHEGRGDTSVFGAKVGVQTTDNTKPPMAKRTHLNQISAPPLPSWERAGVRGGHA